MTLRTYHGSCDCGKVRFVVNLDPKVLSKTSICYVDGLRDNFKTEPDFIGHL